MPNLKLIVQNEKGTSYTLRPNREYIVGSSKSECQILLTDDQVSGQHLKFCFNQNENTWYINDLGSARGTFVNNQRVTSLPIRTQTHIVLAQTSKLVAIPETPVVQAGQENIFPTETPLQVPPVPPISIPTQPVSPTTVPQASFPTRTYPTKPQEAFEVKSLTWRQYVDQQVRRRKNLLSRIATNFYLTTGLRSTPWIRLNDDYINADFGFDGYIIPNFLEKGSPQEVGTSIIDNITKLRQYENTDCFIAELTDEHLTNSAKETILQQIFSYRFFPVRRRGDGKYDYRKFLVISYNQVRTYLMIEGYGTDLFVSWITRYEPNIPPGIVYWLITAVMLSLLSIPSGLLAVTVPVSVWLIVYLVLPQLMKTFNILPKKANAHLLAYLLITGYISAFIGGILTPIEASVEGNIITSIGISIGRLVIILLYFAISLIINFIYIGGVSWAIWWIEKIASNKNID